MKKILVLGANGATGKLLVQQLLQKDKEVIAIVRDTSSLAQIINTSEKLQIIEADITSIPIPELVPYVAQCETVCSCLGHNVTFTGIFGHPRKLVTGAMQKVVSAIESMETDKKIKIILMNTTGNQNRDIPEKPPMSQRLVVFLLRHLLPPHTDNEAAADFLRVGVGKNNNHIEWVVVRPDGLIDEHAVTQYDIHITPIRNVIFNAGSTSRINVADFMSELAIHENLWNSWKYQMPVIYNQNTQKK